MKDGTLANIRLIDVPGCIMDSLLLVSIIEQGFGVEGSYCIYMAIIEMELLVL